MRHRPGEVVIESEGLKSGFVQVPVVVLEDPSISGGAKLAYAMLLWYGWDQRNREGPGYPGQEHMAAQMGTSKRSVVTYLGELENAGYIRRTKFGQGRPDAIALPEEALKCKNCTSRSAKSALVEAQDLHRKNDSRETTLENDDTDSSDGPNGNSDSFIEEIARKYGRDRRDAKALVTSLKKYPIEAVRWAVQELRNGLSEITNPGAWLNAVVPQLAEELQERNREQITKKQQDLMIIRATAGLFRRVDPPERVVERLCEAWPEELVQEALGRTSRFGA